MCEVQGTQRIGMCFSSVIDSPVCIPVDSIRDLGPSCPDRPHLARRIYSLVITRSTSISLQKLQKKYESFGVVRGQVRLLLRNCQETVGALQSIHRHVRQHTSAYVSMRQHYGPYNVRTVRRLLELSWSSDGWSPTKHTVRRQLEVEL